MGLSGRNGIYVGKVDKNDEFLVLTPSGTYKVRAVKRLSGDESHDAEFLKTIKGSPWNPEGVPVHEVQERKDEFPQTQVRRMCLRQHLLERYGRTPGWEEEEESRSGDRRGSQCWTIIGSTRCSISNSPSNASSRRSRNTRWKDKGSIHIGYCIDWCPPSCRQDGE